MTEYHRRQMILFSRPASWWAGLEWACPSNFLVDASMQVAVWVVASRHSTGSLKGSHGNQGCVAYLNTSMNTGCQDCESGKEVQGCTAYSNKSMNVGCQGRESEREVWGCVAYLNKSMNMGHQDHKSGREVDHKSLMTHYALDWGPEVALRLSDDSALLLRVVHTMVVPRGGEGALASGAETHLVEPFGSAAFDYPHPPRAAGLDLKEDFDCH
ncbi:hypothetical protein EDD16DRAFT_1521895 [Pisolithus croceorrhizus]|nr:hypothetical protein EDD16DRAFT_1521895 [Pisolithus croceorrhizus]